MLSSLFYPRVGNVSPHRKALPSASSKVTATLADSRTAKSWWGMPRPDLPCQGPRLRIGGAAGKHACEKAGHGLSSSVRFQPSFEPSC